MTLDPNTVSDTQALALQVVDAFVWQPVRWPPGLGRAGRGRTGSYCGKPEAQPSISSATPDQARSPVAKFDADDPQVETGVEYFDIDVSAGELRYDVSPVAPSA